MQRSEIPDQVLRFIERRIDSVPHLEALLLLHENAAASWTDGDVAARVYIAREQARVVLADLARHGLIEAGEGMRYRYNAGWDTEKLMDRVAATYRGHLVHVAGVIHAKAASAAVRDFARAFQFKEQD